MEGPKQIELDQIKLEDEMLKTLKNLKKAERRAAKDFNKFIRRYGDVIGEFKNYKNLVFDSSRNYIQMLNQDSEIIDNTLLNITKEHVKRLEKTISAHTELDSLFKEMSNTHNEYVNNLEKLEDSWDALVKTGYSWYDDFNSMMKEKGQYASGGKLGRLEKSLEKNHERLKKAYDQKIRSHQLVETSYDHLNRVLQKLKAAISNIRW